jgi:hypothetical protein
MSTQAENVENIFVNLDNVTTGSGSDHRVVKPLHSQRAVDKLGNEPRIGSR